VLRVVPKARSNAGDVVRFLHAFLHPIQDQIT